MGGLRGLDVERAGADRIPKEEPISTPKERKKCHSLVGKEEKSIGQGGQYLRVIGSLGADVLESRRGSNVPGCAFEGAGLVDTCLATGMRPRPGEATRPGDAARPGEAARRAAIILARAIPRNLGDSLPAGSGVGGLYPQLARSLLVPENNCFG